MEKQKNYLSERRAPWLFENDLQVLLSALSDEKEEARIVGGAIRNTLLGEPVGDIDIATTTLPKDTIARAKRVGFHVIPTAIDFGTVTTVLKGRTCEITTLRTDVKTDGRRVEVCFGRDWKIDAKRRDFTVNALYVDKNGKIYDDVCGLQDVKSHVLRFIGNAENRIKEDYLRILRFFRFYAWMGDSCCPDIQGMKAITKLKDSLDCLSVERIWSELKKLLIASDPIRSLLWMHRSGVLKIVLPEIENFDVESIRSLVETEKLLSWKADPLLRLESIMLRNVGQVRALVNRLKLSNNEKKRLIQWARSDTIPVNISDVELKKHIYCEGRQLVLDRLHLSFSALRDHCVLALKNYERLDDIVRSWRIPIFPVNGLDIMMFGFSQGPKIRKVLSMLKNIWIQSGFQLDKNSLLSFLQKKNKKL